MLPVGPPNKATQADWVADTRERSQRETIERNPTVMTIDRRRNDGSILRQAHLPCYPGDGGHPSLSQLPNIHERSASRGWYQPAAVTLKSSVAAKSWCFA
ncbi:hypothetical protein MRX96_030855 [Rhipicephalus microplus]